MPKKRLEIEWCTCSMLQDDMQENTKKRENDTTPYYTSSAINAKNELPRLPQRRKHKLYFMYSGIAVLNYTKFSNSICTVM